MSGSAPLVLSSNVLTVDDDDLDLGYSLSLEETKPAPPPRPLSILSRRSFGVYPSNDADKAVNALHFDTHLADAPAVSHLMVRGEGAGYMSILAVLDNLVVLQSCFQTYQSPVYLLYDAVEHSITMIPSHPWLLTPPPYKPGEKCETAAAIRVLIARPPGGDDRSYALVNMAVRSFYSGYAFEPVKKEDVLYVWRSSSLSPQWDMISTNFPSKFKDVADDRYTKVVAFTCGGHAFWANLPRGLMYCRIDAMLSTSTSTSTGGGRPKLKTSTRGGRPKLKFGFIELPVEHPPSAILRDSTMYQTIGRSGESSIKFVTIDGFVQLWNFSSCTLKVWSLSPGKHMTNWTKSFLCLGSLVKQDEFKNLPTDMVPMYPSLSVEEEDVVYFMLGQYKKCCREHKRSNTKCEGYIPAAKNPMYHLRVDMRRGVLLASARPPNSASPSLTIATTSVLPSSMIQRGSMDRKFKRRCGDGNPKKTERRAFSQ